MELKIIDWGLTTWTAISAIILGLAVFLIVRYMLRQLKK